MKIFYCDECPQSLSFSIGNDFPQEGLLEVPGKGFACCNEESGLAASGGSP